MFKKLLISSILALSISSFTVSAAQTFSDTQKDEIGKIVHEYIVSNPEVLIEAQQSLELKYQEQADLMLNKAIEYFTTNENIPVKGKRGSDKYVIEFFDYNCGYCKIARVHTERYAKENNAAVYYVEFPILSRVSLSASVIGSALYKIDSEKYLQYQELLMTSKDKLVSEDQIKDALKKVGTSWDEVVAKVNETGAQDIVKKNLEFGELLGVRGTPFFIINGKVIKGAVRTYDDLLEHLKD